MTQTDTSSEQLPPIPISGLDRLLCRALLAVSTSKARRSEAEMDTERPSSQLSSSDFEKFSERLGDAADFAGMDILDVGCGEGDLAICIERVGARVTGIDTDFARTRAARAKAETLGCRAAEFIDGDFLEHEFDRSFDRIVSLEAFEHVAHPSSFLRRMADLLVPGGKVLSIFGPMWLSPFGGHLQGFTQLPWAHLIFPERVVMTVRRRVFRPTDPATCYSEQRGGLNQLTVRQFKKCVAESGLQLERFELNPQFRVGRFRNSVVRSASDLVTSIPGVGEFFSHTALCVLGKPERPRAKPP